MLAPSSLSSTPAIVRVLLVEDDPDDAFLIERRLQAATVAAVATFDVHHVGGLGEAAEVLPTAAWDVIVLDLGLPDSDGIDTVERLIQLDPPCAVVVMTGASESDLVPRSFALGVSDYLPKSAAATELLPRVLMHAVEREATKAAVAARMAAEEANVTKSAFLSRISHELRTPLHAIMGFARLLESEATTDDDREATGIIVKASEHLLTLINDVLDLSRLETGDLSLSPEPIDVGPIVDEAIDLVSGRYGEARIVVDVGDVGSRPLYGDPTRVRQVLLNLLSNAVKYGPADGVVTVAASPRFDGRIRLTVGDQGPGIPPESLPDLFAPFERLGQESSTIDGVGLGLTITRELVRAMGGDIGVESAPGIGTTFWFDLPAGLPAPSL